MARASNLRRLEHVQDQHLIGCNILYIGIRTNFFFFQNQAMNIEEPPLHKVI